MEENRQEELLKQGFTQDQIAEIKEGEQAGLDTAVYARKEFLAIQMRQIRLGQEAGIDAAEYARAEYDWFQMEEIRKGLTEGVDIRLYARSEIPYDKMRQVRKGLKKGIDLSPYLYLDAGVLQQLRKALCERVSIVEYIREGYDTEQLEEIRLALKKGVSIGKYLRKEFRGASIAEIAEGLAEGLDVSVYADIQYGWQQMQEIRLGMENRVDVREYLSPYYRWKQMREIRLGLEDGLDVSDYRSLMYTAKEMQKCRIRLLEGMVASVESSVAERLLGETESELDALCPIRIRISRDEMTAYAEPACGAQKGAHSHRLTREQIEEALRRRGIERGVLQGGIDELLMEREISEPVLIAKGRPAVQGTDGWYEYFFDTDKTRAPQVLQDGSVDYQNISWFEQVEKGEKIACYHRAKTGIPGYTVTGKLISAARGREKRILTGRGFALEEDGVTYVATLGGRIELERVAETRRESAMERIWISPLLVLEEVTLSTGNIDFDGSVYIRGNVGAGTVVKATEELIVEGYVESAVLDCGGNILLKQGMNAVGEGSIHAGGSVQGKFFEAVSIYAGGDIQANYSLNSNLYAEGVVAMLGSKGSISGGCTYAAKGIEAYHIGNRAGIETVIGLGANERTRKRQAGIETKLRDVGQELLILGNSYVDFQRKYPAEVRNAMPLYLKIESAIYTKEKEFEAVQAEKRQTEEETSRINAAKAVIKGCLYEGTFVEIDYCRWQAKEARNITIKKVDNRIAVFAN